MEVIRLRKLAIFPRLGVDDHERVAVQRAEVDLTLWANLRRAADTDELPMTIDYTRLYDAVQEIASRRPYHLVEALAEAIAKEMVRAFPVVRARARVRKFHLPFRANLKCIEVEFEEAAPAGAAPARGRAARPPAKAAPARRARAGDAKGTKRR
jgi:dihydroneopterin aldolase